MHTKTESECVPAWQMSGLPYGYLFGTDCNWGSGGVIRFFYSAQESVTAYLTGSCASNAALRECNLGI